MLHHDPSIGSFPTVMPSSDDVRVWPRDVASAASQPSPASRAREAEGARNEPISYILTDCFVSLGQGVGSDKTIEQAAIMWLHERYRDKFLKTMEVFGNTWMRDRPRVKGVSRMLGERAVYYAGDSPTIDLASVMRASAAVEKYCRLHAARRARSRDGMPGDQPVRHAGYWCEV